MATVPSCSDVSAAAVASRLALAAGTSVTGSSHRPAGSVGGYQIVLQMRPGLASVALSGTLDGASADALGGMISADGPVTRRVELSCGSVTSATVSAVELLVAAALERHQHGLAPVVLVELSDSVAAALDELGLAGRPPIFLAGMPVFHAGTNESPSVNSADQEEDRCV